MLVEVATTWFATYVVMDFLLAVLFQSQAVGEGLATGLNTEINVCIADGKSLDEALRFTYPRRYRTIEDLEKSWKAMLGSGVPKP